MAVVPLTLALPSLPSWALAVPPPPPLPPLELLELLEPPALPPRALLEPQPPALPLPSAKTVRISIPMPHTDPPLTFPTAKGTKTPKGTVENSVASAAGAGAASGLPTTADDGTITMTFHQVNQDGAGPLTASIDATSGGTDPAAFQDAKVTQNVPGIGIGGLSAATTTDFPVKVQMPQGMTCSGTAGGASNVCIVRMQNSALAGPFGGSAAFTQSAAAKKRAVEYNLRKRHMARGILGKPE